MKRYFLRPSSPEEKLTDQFLIISTVELYEVLNMRNTFNYV